MFRLEQSQKDRSLEAMREYFSSSADVDGQTPVESDQSLDEDRIKIIADELQPILSKFLQDKMPLTEFKSQIDGINKRNPHWGFKGIKGQMFFNMILNVAGDLEECTQEIKSAILVPTNEQMASSKLDTFTKYITRIGNEWVDAGNTRYGMPKVGSVTFFLSYFWQIQDRDNWPVYYTNTVNTLKDLNIWQPIGDMASDYLLFRAIHEELQKLFSNDGKKSFSLYDVEHVFWFKGENPYLAIKQPVTKEKDGRATHVPADTEIFTVEGRLPESYVPPIVAILPLIAKADESLSDAVKLSGISMERAFEKYIDAAFTILGYETKPLGQGHGRVPDGLAIAIDERYAIIWDAKVRSVGYSIGTDDRTIREYVESQSRDLKRRYALRNIYYMIISSQFKEGYDDAIRFLKMETDISEVIFLESEALVAMVDANLRAPIEFSLGPDGLQRLFTASGVLAADWIREELL